MPANKSIRSRFNQLKSHPRWIRMPLGILLVLGGVFGALPILGFWMLPLGLILLSVDFPWARRALAHLKLWWRRIKGRFRRYSNKNPILQDTTGTGQTASGASKKESAAD